MVDVIIRELLGNWGEKILDTYLRYSLYINSIILVYVGLIVLSRRNYQRISEHLIQNVIDHYQDKARKKDRRQIEKFLKTIDLPWEEALNLSRYPFVTPPHRFLLYVKNEKTIRRFLSIETIACLLEQHHQNNRNSIERG